MTAACNGGISGAKPGAAAVVDYTSGLLAAIFAAYDIAWLIPVIPIVGLGPLTLNQFCQSDPPAMPVLTADEANAILQIDVTSPNYLSGLAKFKDVCLNLIWFDACQCTSGTMVAPQPPAPPIGTAVPQYQTPTTGAACIHFDGGTGIDVIGNTDCADTWTIEWFDKNGTQIGSKVLATVHLGQTLTAQAAIPPNTINGSLNVASAGGCGNFANAFPNLQGVGNPTLAVFTLSQTYDQPTNTIHRGHVVDIYCGSVQPISQVSQCCPADPAAAATLDAILRMVTLLQRQTAPFGYVIGFEHDNLTGTGELAVQGLLGAKITPSRIPTWAGQELGDPDTLWLDSWINWGNNDGWTAREFLRSSPHVSLPPLAGQFTTIGYSLAPGLTVSITELVREA